MPVVVKQLDDESALAISLIENLQREDLNPLEETEGILQLLALKLKSEIEEVPRTLYRLQKGLKNQDEELSGEPIIDSLDDESESSHNVMGKTDPKSNEAANQDQAMVEEVFNGLGLMNWESFVKNRLPLLNLPEDIKLALREGQIAYTKAKAIASLKDEEPRAALLAEAIEKQLSLTQIKERIKELQPASSSSQPQEIPDRLKAAYQQVKKTRIWEDKKKRRQLETLLNKLEALIGQT